MSEKKSFWNWIGLPDASDMRALRDLLQTQSAQLSRIERENYRLRKRAGQLEKVLAFRQEQCAAQISREISEQIQSSASEIAQKLDGVQQKSMEREEKLLFTTDKTYDALVKSAQNQDELLRILIVNALQDEVNAALDAEKAKGKPRKSKAR